MTKTTRPMLISEAAHQLQCSESMTRRLADSGVIPTQRTARNIRILDGDAVQRLAAQRAEQRAAQRAAKAATHRCPADSGRTPASCSSRRTRAWCYSRS
jgi:hypothetical protein